MGLDIVELFMRVEEEFGIAILDLEAQEAYTVGKLYNLVLSKVVCESTDVCLTSACFYRTRKALMGVLQVPKQQIRPDTPLETLIPEHDRAAIWASIESAHTLTIPRLRMSLISLRRQFPKNVRTVGDLARQVLFLNHKKLAAEYRGWNADDVWNTLRRVIVDETAVTLEKVTHEAGIVEDLRLW